MPNVEPRLDPTLDLALLNQSEEIKYAGMEEIFLWLVRWQKLRDPGDSGVTDQQADIRLPPPVPPPPPITLKFFGFANRPGETKKGISFPG